MTPRNAFYAVVVILSAIAGQACLDGGSGAGSAVAQDAVTRAEFDTLLARVAALEADRPGDKVVAAAAGAGSATIQKAAAAGGAQLGTAVGFLPASAPAHQARYFSLKSNLGYLYAVPNEPNTNGVVGISGLGSSGGVVPAYYETADCTGQAYVSGTHLSSYGAQEGVVFRLHAGEFNQTIDQPAQYFYVAEGTARVDSLAYNSQTSNIDACTSEVGTLTSAYPALPNDAGVTGVQSAPVSSPVTLSEPAA